MKKSFLIILVFFSTFLCATTGKIIGKVLSKIDNEPIPGVYITIKDTKNGAISNKKGKFSINIAPGKYQLTATLIGYTPLTKNIKVNNNETTKCNFLLQQKSIELDGLTISANRAVERETPISFTNIKEEDIKNKYTTQDMPEILESVSGIFSSSTGLGEADISMRGFDAEKIQIMVNGIPVNDPESQVVYWSNWTGLSSNVKSVQVQKGTGSSLYGSGAFGGSVNIETMGSEKKGYFSIRNSVGFYNTQGKVADGKGKMINRTPVNYSFLLKYNSGKVFDNKHSFQITAERKAGDSYIIGTEYDGWSFGFETDHRLGDHKINGSFIVAPQKHNQARIGSEEFLMNHLGREYSSSNHKWQENKYVKPQFSIRDKWKINKNQLISLNAFITMGNGRGSYLSNSKFDVNTGEISYLNLNPLRTEARKFANHARYAYLTTCDENGDNGIILEGYDPVNNKFTYTDANGNEHSITPLSNTENIESYNLVNDKTFSSKTYSFNKHKQIGLNGYYEYTIPNLLFTPKIITGGECRLWYADHYTTSENFRYRSFTTNELDFYDKVQRRYDYSSKVVNLSGFLRSSLKFDILSGINILLDGQYAKYYQEIDENPIEIYDYYKGEFTGKSYYITKDLIESIEDENGNIIYKKKFSKSDYNRDFDFFSPKAGVNLNLNKNINFIANYSIAYKEPKVKDWYDRGKGPGQPQWNENTKKYYSLKPEKTETFEIGLGYKTPIYKLDITLYNTVYTDKIERTKTLMDESVTINAGKATHKGIEIGSTFKYEQWSASASATFAKNRWDKMNVKTIFYLDASEVVDKVVPYSPELMANGSVDYLIEELYIPGTLKLELSGRWWDRYYTSYNNKYHKYEYSYYDNDGDPYLDEDGNPFYKGKLSEDWTSSKLPYFFEMNCSIAYNIPISNKDLSIKLNLNNITNRKQYSKGINAKIYGHPNTAYTHYVTPAPLFNVFLTTEIKF